MIPYKNPELIEIENDLIPRDSRFDYYKGVFAEIRRSESIIFNSQAFMWHFAWLIYRKCAIGWFMMLLSSGAYIFGFLNGIIVYAVLNLIIAFFGNGMYHGSIKKKAQEAEHLSAEDRESFVGRNRGVDTAMATVAGITYSVLVIVFFLLGKGMSR